MIIVIDGFMVEESICEELKHCIRVVIMKVHYKALSLLI